jgi:glyoxylase-like metal-dependent hydrolase (beta-lactamase superfamily II)
MDAMIQPLDVGYLGLQGAANAYLLAGASGCALIECGTAATWPTLVAQLARHGVRPQQITDVLLTHIHLDHAGAAGHLAELGARVWVHPFGRPHLIDPAKLLASSRRVHGAAYDAFYGDLRPVPASLVHAVEDGGVVDACGWRFHAIATPGHARHHHAWLLESGARRHLFSGDVLGIVVPGSSFICIPTPPPEFEPREWIASVHRLRGSAPTHVWLTHGGLQSRSTEEAAAFIDRAASRVSEESEVLRTLATGVASAGPRDSDEFHAALQRAVEAYRQWLRPRTDAAGVDAQRFRDFLADGFLRMSLLGAVRMVSTLA